jgi:hypothetical protein
MGSVKIHPVSNNQIGSKFDFKVPYRPKTKVPATRVPKYFFVPLRGSYAALWNLEHYGIILYRVADPAEAHLNVKYPNVKTLM